MDFFGILNFTKYGQFVRVCRCFTLLLREEACRVELQVSFLPQKPHGSPKADPGAKIVKTAFLSVLLRCGCV